MEVEMLSVRRNIGKATAKAFVGEELACTGELYLLLYKIKKNS